jgi:hypothetical protein
MASCLARASASFRTAPVDWSAVIASALPAEHAHIYEVVGQALGEFREELLDEVEPHEKERNKRYKKKLKAMTDDEVAAAVRLNDSKTWWMRELA